jgi:hypothetical protein
VLKTPSDTELNISYQDAECDIISVESDGELMRAFNYMKDKVSVHNISMNNKPDKIYYHRKQSSKR